MPGELDRKADGTAAMFSVQQTPWHREGTILSEAPRDVMAALKLAGLDFDVELRSIFTSNGPRWSEITDHRATYRTDRGEPLGVVGANGTFEIARVSRLLRHNASASIVVYSDFANRPAEHVFRLCRAGVRAAITLGVDDRPLRVRSVLAAASNADRLDGLPTEMRQILGATAADVFRTALSGTTKPYEPDDLARDLGLERRTLERTLQACGLPAPARLIAYCRLLHAARLMENSDRKITGIARILGFIDDSKLRKQFSMRVGACATEISRSDAVATVFEAFLQACPNGGADRRTPDTREIATLPANARTVVAFEHVIDARRHAG